MCQEDAPSRRWGEGALPPFASLAAAASDPSRQNPLGSGGDERDLARVRFSRDKLSPQEPVSKGTLGFYKQQFVLLWEKETVQEKPHSFPFSCR